MNIFNIISLIAVLMLAGWVTYIYLKVKKFLDGYDYVRYERKNASGSR